MNNKQLLLHFRHRIGEKKSNKHNDLNYLKHLWTTGLEIHHTVGIQYSDYWAVLLTPEQHVLAHKNWADSFVRENLYAWSNLIGYAFKRKVIEYKTYGEALKNYVKKDFDNDVGVWLNLIEKIKEVK